LIKQCGQFTAVEQQGAGAVDGQHVASADTDEVLESTAALQGVVQRLEGTAQRLGRNLIQDLAHLGVRRHAVEPVQVPQVVDQVRVGMRPGVEVEHRRGLQVEHGQGCAQRIGQRMLDRGGAPRIGHLTEGLTKQLDQSGGGELSAQTGHDSSHGKNTLMQVRPQRYRTNSSNVERVQAIDLSAVAQVAGNR